MPDDASGQYELVQQLGEGGFARVWKAREKSTGRTVALKLLKESLRADAEVLERFRREIFAVASIDSPYVVRMFDFGVAGGDSFLAMEFVEGLSLRELLSGKPWPAGEIHVVIGQVCQALAAAHQVGIIHRDLKPENIMLVPGKDGTRHVKVLDFGFAKLLDLERKLELEPITQAGYCFGTPQYMAPEQMQGKPVEPSVDLFAVSVITYEMLSGTLPWNGKDAREIFSLILKTPAPPIKRVHPSVRELGRVNELLQSALARKKMQRPPSADALFAALESALFGALQSKSGGTFASIMGKTISIPNLAFEPTPALGVGAIPDGNTFAGSTFGGNTFGGGTFGGRTEVDAPPPKMTPHRLPSGWHGSILDAELGMDIAAEDESATTTARSMTGERVQPASRRIAAKRSETMQVERDKPSRLNVWWLVLVAVLLAGAVGYYVGTLKR